MGRIVIALVLGAGSFGLAYVLWKAGKEPGLTPFWGAQDEREHRFLGWIRLGCMGALALTVLLGGLLGVLGIFVGGAE